MSSYLQLLHNLIHYRKSLSVTCAVYKGTQIKWKDQLIIPLNHILVQFVEMYFPEHNVNKKNMIFFIQAYKEVLI